MSQIEVPDWVVSKVLDELFPGNSGYVIPNYRDPMKAALAAALGAWVVPACYRQHQPNHSSEWISGMYGGPPFTHKAWSVEQAYTLRQEKPE